MTAKQIAAQDPFDVLPFEPFVSCIQLALPLPEKGYTQGLLQFTMVSKKWRDTIVSTPTLWTSITVSRSDPDALAMIGTSLHLSRDAMVTVTFCHTMNQHWDLFCGYIVPHANRIQQIVLIDADLPMSPARSHALQGLLYYVALETVLNWLGDLPAIVSIDIGTSSHGIYSGKPWTRGFIQNVRYMRQWIFQRPGLGDAREPFHQLRGLHTDESIDVILPILPTFLQLERLVISDPVPDSQHLPAPPYKIGSPLPYDVSKLTCLWHTQIFSHSISRLLLETAQNLLELVIRLPYDQINPFIDILMSMERLQTLTLSITTYNVANIVDAIDTSIPPAMTSLRSLSLDDVNDVLGLYVESRSLEVLSRLMAMYPNVTNISFAFTYERDITPILPFLQRLNHLRTMSIVGSIWVQSDAPIACKIPSLEEVSVERGDNLGWLVAPKVLRLLCEGGKFQTLRDFCQRSPLLQSVTLTDDFWSIPTSLEPSSFPSAWEVHVRLRRTAWVKSTITSSPRFYLTSLPSLRKISISSANFDVAFTHTTSLCLALLYQPDICPKLQELVFEGVPEWDILFIMLEARNFSKNPFISHITRITISLIPYHLRSPLASLLRGELATRPSKEDISIEAMSQLFFDKTILGCFTCLHNMLPLCNAPINEFYGRETAVYFHEVFWARLPEEPLPPTTPAHVSTWILARPERIKRWISSREEWGKRDGRRVRCSRRGEAVTITGLND